MYAIKFEDATTEIQEIINQTPRDRDWHEVEGYSICIDDNNSLDCWTAAIYEPGSVCEGECDLYVRLETKPEEAPEEESEADYRERVEWSANCYR